MKYIATKPESKTAVAVNSTTGVIHKVGGSRSVCGSSRKNILIGMDKAINSIDSMFCEKCFPCGKPKEFFQVEAAA